MAEIQSISGNDIYSAEFKEKTMEAYNNFYKNLNQNYIRDEWFDMMWLPNPVDIWKFDTKNPQHILSFINQIHKAERTKDESELEHYRLLYEIDKKLTDKEYEYYKLHYLIKEQERQKVYDKSTKLKDELIKNKNLIKEYTTNEITDETTII